MAKRKSSLGILLLFVLSCSNPLHASENGLFRVLFIASYHPSFPTFHRQLEGIQSAFSDLNVQLDHVYLDSKRFPYSDMKEALYRSLEHKLSWLEPYDGILLADDNALRFILEYGDELFPSLPILFFGVNNRELALEQNAVSRISGLVEAVSMEATLDLALALFPETRSICALSDKTVSGQSDLKLFHSFSDDYPLTSLSLAEMSFDEYRKRLESLSEDTVLLLLSAYRDREDTVLRFDQGLSLIKESTDLPLFHLWYHGMGQGVLGGKLISHKVQAEEAAGMLRSVLLGEQKMEFLAVQDKSPNRYILDYRLLQHYQVEESDIPPSADLLYQPSSFFRQYRRLISLAAAVFFVQLLLIVLLVGSVRKRRRIAADLARSQERLKSLFTYVPVALFEEDLSKVKKRLDGIARGDPQRLRTAFDEDPKLLELCAQDILILDTNQKSIELHEAPSKGVLISDLGSLISTQSSTVLKEELVSLYSGDNFFSCEVLQRSFRGKKFWTRIVTLIAPDSIESWERVYVGVEDISAIKEKNLALARGLQEKTLLLRELHHRVNNNMALIASFLQVRRSLSDDQAVLEVVDENLLRIRAMGLAHKHLLDGKSLQNLDLKAYVEDLFRDIRSIYSSSEKSVDLSLDCKMLVLPIDFLVPLGLLITEIVSNSIHHALPREDPLGIHLSASLELDGRQLSLEIGDNGDWDASPERESKEIGNRFINSLIKQLKGEKTVILDGGYEYTISIPLSNVWKEEGDEGINS